MHISGIYGEFILNHYIETIVITYIENGAFSRLRKSNVQAGLSLYG